MKDNYDSDKAREDYIKSIEDAEKGWMGIWFILGFFILLAAASLIISSDPTLAMMVIP